MITVAMFEIAVPTAITVAFPDLVIHFRQLPDLFSEAF